MSPTKENKDFEWEQGGILDEKNTAPLGGIRSKGMPKLKDAVHADPILRKEKRDKIILDDQSKEYHPIKITEPETDIIIEESQSGLSQDIEDTAAKKLIDTGKKLKGIDRFGKKK